MSRISPEVTHSSIAYRCANRVAIRSALSASNEKRRRQRHGHGSRVRSRRPLTESIVRRARRTTRPLDDGPLRIPNRRTRGPDVCASSPRCLRGSGSPGSPDPDRMRALAPGTGDSARRAHSRAEPDGPHPGTCTHSDHSKRLPAGTSRDRGEGPPPRLRRRRSREHSSSVGSAGDKFRNAVLG